MKKILLVLALTLTGFLSQAQTSYTNYSRNSSPTWNMDTVGAAGATTTNLVSYAESKVASVPTNFIVTLQALFSNNGADSVQSAGITLWGSMDNIVWFKVPLSVGNVAIGTNASTYSPGTAYVNGLQVAGGLTGAGTWPAITGPATTISLSASPVVSTALDTIAVGQIYPSKVKMYNYVILNPTYSYYKFTVTSFGSVNTAVVKNSGFGFRYYLRKPY
jgi:hypothetical protein